MAPLLILAILMLGLTAGESVYNVYNTNEATKISDEYNKAMGAFYGGQFAENTAFWDRYIRAHHIENRNIMFPYRTGYNFNKSQLLQSMNMLDFNNLSRNAAVVHALTSSGKAAARAGYAYTKTDYSGFYS